MRESPPSSSWSGEGGGRTGYRTHMSAISTDDSDPQSMLDFLGDLMSSFFSTIEIFEGEYTDFRDVEDVSNSIMACVCVVCAGLAAGLTMGLLSLDTTKLEIKNMTGTEAEKAAARTLLPIIRQHHLLLVTLLLFNSMANEALPIFLGALVPNYMAVILSVVLILFFGEIIPSAFFTGPQQLLTAARMAGFVWGLMAFFAPISWPIAKVLDCVFGADDENKDKLSREDLGALMILHGRPKSESIGSVQEDPGGGSYQGLAQSDGLHQYEVSVLTGILSLSKTSVGQCMIDIQRVYALEASVALTQAQLKAILASGFSRIPVFRASEEGMVWKGYLLTKSLIALDSATPLSQLSLREPLFVRPSLGLLEMLAMFRQGQCHLAMVSVNPMASLEAVRSSSPCRGDAEVLAIVTLEDVIERILQADIRDETDIVDTDLFSQSYKHGGSPTVLFHGFHKPARTPEAAESSNRMRQLVARASRDRIDEGRERALSRVAAGGEGAISEKSPAGERSQLLLATPAAPSSWLKSPIQLW